MDKIATIKHSSAFQSQKFSVVGNSNSLVSGYNFVNQGTEGDSTTLDIEPVIDFKYNTLPTLGVIRNIPYTCLYNGGDAGYPQILGKQRTFDIITSANNDKVFHRPGDPRHYSTQASEFTSPFLCVAVDDKFFSSSSELYPILLYAQVGNRIDDYGSIVKSFICLNDVYVGTSTMDNVGILSSDRNLSSHYRSLHKEDGVRYTELEEGDEPRSIFRATNINPVWFDRNGVSSILHFNPEMIDYNLLDDFGAYYSYSKYLVGALPTITSNADVEVLITSYYVLDFVFEGEPSPTFGLSDAEFNDADKTYDLNQDDYTWVMHRSSRDKFYVRYIQYRV